MKNEQVNILNVGIYQHYKGKQYEVIGVAKHSETLEDFVVYRCLYENKTSNLWVRPLAIFLEIVTIDGKKVPRFKKVDEDINYDQK